MSESAIESASSSLREALGADMPIFFHVSDMLGYLENVRAEFDVIVAAFALHHLTTEDKQKVCYPRSFAPCEEMHADLLLSSIAK